MTVMREKQTGGKRESEKERQIDIIKESERQKENFFF